MITPFQAGVRASLIIHDWRGLTDYTKTRADMIAKLGYVAFAADIYGKDLRAGNPDVWGKEAVIYKNDRDLFRAPARAPRIRLS